MIERVLDKVSGPHGGQREERDPEQRAEGGYELALPGLRHHVAVPHRAQRDLRLR